MSFGLQLSKRESGHSQIFVMMQPLYHGEGVCSIELRTIVVVVFDVVLSSSICDWHHEWWLGKSLWTINRNGVSVSPQPDKVWSDSQSVPLRLGQCKGDNAGQNLPKKEAKGTSTLSFRRGQRRVGRRCLASRNRCAFSSS